MRTLDVMQLIFRSLRSKIRFLAVALTTLAISIGACVTMFAVVNSFLLSSLPYEGADRLVMIWRTNTELSKGHIDDDLPLSPGELVDLGQNDGSFEAIAGFNSGFANVTADGEPRRRHLVSVAGDFFSVMRVKAELGRTPGPQDQRPSTTPVVAISHRFWQELGSAPEVIGRSLKLGSRHYEIVGVLPADFRLVESLAATDQRLSKPVDVWAPLILEAGIRQRGFRFLFAVGRLQPGASLDAAREEVRAYAKYAAEEYASTDKAYGMKVVSLSEQIFGHLRPVLLALWTATLLVLLIACVNLATLLMAREHAGHRDVAVRLALGASRLRIFGESILESVAIAAVGGLLSLPVAHAGTRLLTALNPVNVFHSHPPRVDLRVFGFTIAIALVTGLLFGGIPALRASRIHQVAGLREGSVGLSRRSRLTFSVLLVSQIALTTTLLIGTGLSARSFVRLSRSDLGLDLEGVVTLDVALPLSQYRETPRKLDFFRELLKKTRGLPGVESVGMNYALPLSGVDPSNSFRIEGRPPPPEGEIQSANLGLVNPDYFKTLRIPLRRGRLFRESDTQDATPVAIVDERMVRQYFGREEPLGQQIRVASNEKTTIVGVVGAIRQRVFEERARPWVYLPYQQRCYMFTSLAIKTSLEDPLALTTAVRAVVRDLDQEMPIANVSTLESAHRDALAPQRFSLLLISVFAGLAFFLTQVGTYGVMSFLALQRRREVRIRMALGAEPKRIRWLVFRQASTSSLLGTAIGAGIAIGAEKLMASLVHNIGTFDLSVFLMVSAATLLAVFVVCYLPARSLSEVEPSVGLRSM